MMRLAVCGAFGPSPLRTELFPRSAFGRRTDSHGPSMSLSEGPPRCATQRGPKATMNRETRMSLNFSRRRVLKGEREPVRVTLIIYFI